MLDRRYNVEGSLLRARRVSADERVHDCFNTRDHKDWSQHALSTDFKAIVKKCGTKSCVSHRTHRTTPKSRPTGTYYGVPTETTANVVHEYAAELAVRYFKEQTEMLANGKLAAKAFKCDRPRTAEVAGLVDEFLRRRRSRPRLLSG